MIASLGSLVCITLGRFLCTKQGRWHFRRFGIIASEIVRDMQGFSRGGEELNWRIFCETQVAVCSFLPTVIFMYYVMFAALRIETHNEFPI